ncbi:MAG: hypothetical protein FJ125_01060, partial [Deltaproteobacteria bacterium]|nr:hypothetical protein [Deltaproteobacteria bacterium]
MADAAVPPGTQLLTLVLDEEVRPQEPPRGWFRTVSSVPGYVEGGPRFYERVVAFAFPTSLEEGRSTQLQRQGATRLAGAGLLLGRVLDAEARPLAGARIVARRMDDGAERSHAGGGSWWIDWLAHRGQAC